MDRQTIILITVFLLIMAASIFFTYERYIVMEKFDYETDPYVFEESLLIEE